MALSIGLLWASTAAAGLVVLTLAGCTSTNEARQGTYQLSAAQKVAYTSDLAAAERVCLHYALSPCSLTRIKVVPERVLGPDGSGGVLFSTREVLIPVALYTEVPEWGRHVILAHEWSHLLLDHTRRPECKAGWGRGACEIEATQRSVWVIRAAWAELYSFQQAISNVWGFLNLKAGRPGTQGHFAGCEEIQAFSTTFKLNVPASCAPVEKPA